MIHFLILRSPASVLTPSTLPPLILIPATNITVQIFRFMEADTSILIHRKVLHPHNRALTKKKISRPQMIAARHGMLIQAPPGA